MSKFQTSLFMIIFIGIKTRISHCPINQVEITSHQMSSAFFKEEWKRMVTSAAQAQGRQDTMGIHLPPNSTQPFLKGERYHSSTVSPCAQILLQHQGDALVSGVSFNVCSVKPRHGCPKLCSERYACVYKRKEFNIY